MELGNLVVIGLTRPLYVVFRAWIVGCGGDVAARAAELQALLDEPWGKKAVRMAIAIGTDADHEVLQKFIAHSELKPLQANNPEALVNHIKWVSTAVLKSASSPASQTNGASPGAVNVPIPQPPGAPTTAADVW